MHQIATKESGDENQKDFEFYEARLKWRHSTRKSEHQETNIKSSRQFAQETIEWWKFRAHTAQIRNVWAGCEECSSSNRSEIILFSTKWTATKISINFHKILRALPYACYFFAFNDVKSGQQMLNIIITGEWLRLIRNFFFHLLIFCLLFGNHIFD